MSGISLANYCHFCTLDLNLNSMTAFELDSASTHADNNSDFQFLPAKHASFIRPPCKAVHLHCRPRPSLKLQALCPDTDDLIIGVWKM